MADNWKNDPSQSGGKSGNMPDTQHKPDQGQQQRPGQPNPSQQKPSDRESDMNQQSEPRKKAS